MFTRGGISEEGGRRRPAGRAASVLLGAAALVGAAATPGCDEQPPAGEPIRTSAVYGGLGDTPGRFAIPRAMAADPADGTLFVIDKTGRVQRLDAATGACIESWHMPLTSNGKPTGCTISPGDDGRPLLYVADTHYHRVMIFRVREYTPGAAGRQVRLTDPPELAASFGEYGTGPGQFIFPTDVAVLPGPGGKGAERLYVSEYGGNDRVSVFDGSFHFLFSFGTYGSDRTGAGVQFDRPQSLLITDAPEGGRELVVTDSRNHRLGRFTLDGVLKKWLGAPDGPGNAPGEFRIPYGLEDLGDGTVLTAEFGNNRVQRIDLATGAGLGTWGRPGREDGELASPWAVSVLGTTAFVVDSGNNRVLGFAAPRRRQVK